jgi:hypothetical protein
MAGQFLNAELHFLPARRILHAPVKTMFTMS